jgi:acyl-coenzyme A thioesterase PaaI-like protein
VSDEPPSGGLEARSPPEGFQVFDRRGPFSLHNGPFFFRPTSEGAHHGFFALHRHCNGLGIVHGGLLSSFVDGMLGHAVGAHAKASAVTIHLSLDFLSMAREGDWVQGEAHVTRGARDLFFAEARAFVGQRDVLRATAIFKRMARHAAQS